jgi:hypothetical protein
LFKKQSQSQKGAENIQFLRPHRNSWIPKGRIISECLFDFLNFPKKQQKIRQFYAPESKKWSNHIITQRGLNSLVLSE